MGRRTVLSAGLLALFLLSFGLVALRAVLRERTDREAGVAADSSGASLALSSDARAAPMPRALKTWAPLGQGHVDGPTTQIRTEGGAGGALAFLSRGGATLTRAVGRPGAPARGPEAEAR